MENPFDNPTTIRTPESFIGREENLRSIFSLLKKKQNISLVGPKRIGKTSLLNSLRDEGIQRRFHFDGSDFLFFYLDLQNRSMETRFGFFDDINSALKERSQGYCAEDGESKVDEFHKLLDGFQQRKLYPVLMIDTCDELAHAVGVEVRVLTVLRGAATGGQISCVTASVEPLGEIESRLLPTDAKISPLHNIFKTIRLRPFAEEEARALLVDLSARGGLPFNEEEVDAALDMAGGHPYLLQHVASALFEEKRTHAVEGVHLERVRKEAMQDLASYFKDCWNELNDKQRQRLLAEIREGGMLEDSEYPELNSSGLFREYLQVTGIIKKTSSVDMNVEDLKKILKKASDPLVLGKSLLIEIPFIAEQIEQQYAITPFSKGRIVRKALENALESIGGQEKRSDYAPDWLHYNILYYRYFMLRHGMNQEGIAHHLNISPRQYYRLLPEAIDRLRCALLTMDEDARSG